MKEKEIWMKLLLEAKKVLNPREISEFVEAGGVAAALLTTDGNIYTGVCIDTACSLGFCAERNAIGTMITNGENEVVKNSIERLSKYYNLYIVSDAWPSPYRVLKNIGIDKYFKCIYISSAYSTEKKNNLFEYLKKWKFY